MSIRDRHEVPLGHYGVLQQTKVDGALDHAVEQVCALGYAIFDPRYSGYSASFSESQAWRFNARNVQVDLEISCIVMEHLDESAELQFMAAAVGLLNATGRMIGLVPGPPAHWGIEDDIAGHCRRYTRAGLSRLAQSSHWTVLHMAGLTFPLSNMLLPLSNHLVRWNESAKLTLSALERTKQSGRRTVRFKTQFPSALGIVLNRVTLRPLHWVQKIITRSEKALVLYFEAQPPKDLIYG